MAKITYVHSSGAVTVLDVSEGNSVMRGAVLNGVDGIVGQCGGGAMCGTCHVYVDEQCGVPLPAMKPVEDELLYGTASPRLDNSRLSCQLKITNPDELDGLVVHLPEKQL
jgi:ferredoxin, 2Fe-2S